MKHIGRIIPTSTQIQPVNTFYSLSYTDFSTYLGYPIDTETNQKCGLLLPNGSNTYSYWIASRCIETWSSGCNFVLRYVSGGGIYNLDSSDSYGTSVYHNNCGLFPIVTLSAGALSGSNGSYTYAPAS